MSLACSCSTLRSSSCGGRGLASSGGSGCGLVWSGSELEVFLEALVAIETAEGDGLSVSGVLRAESLLDPSASRQ